MGQSSRNWIKFFYKTSNAGEQISSLPNEKFEKTLAMLEIRRSQLPPPQHMNMNQRNCGSFQYQQPFNLQNPMINEGIVLNPPTFTHHQQKLAAAQYLPAFGNCSSGSTVQSFHRFPQNDLPVGNWSRRRKKIEEDTEEAIEAKRQSKIRKRAAAAKFRANEMVHRAQKKEELKELEVENARIKQLQAEAIRKQRKELEEEMKERQQTKAEKTAEKFKALRRTLSTPW